MKHALLRTLPGRAIGRTWVIDPLDGTVNYANGIPIFCVSIAMLVDGQPAVGVVHDPTRGETFAAAIDGAATLDARLIAVSDKERLGDYVISMALGGRAATLRARAIRKRIRVSRSMGSAALALAYVANGRFDAFIQWGGLSSVVRRRASPSRGWCPCCSAGPPPRAPQADHGAARPLSDSARVAMNAVTHRRCSSLSGTG